MTEPGAAASPFPQDALEANRRGRLTTAQRQGWTGAERNWSGTVRLLALVLAVAGVGLLTGAAKTNLPAIVAPVAGVGCLIVAAFFVYLSVLGGSALARDLRDGRVESVEGAIAKSRQQVNAGAEPGFYYLEVAGLRLRCGLATYNAAPEAGIVRVYYLPRSHKAVSFERLADRPLPPGSLDDPLQAVAGVAHGLGSHDRTQRADAMATIAAVKDAMVERTASPPASQRDPRPLAEAIVGAWNGAMMNVTFSADGSATAALVNGMTQDGQWSVGADGKLRLVGLGQNMTTDAWVAGDSLTVVMDATPMSFRRANGG